MDLVTANLESDDVTVFLDPVKRAFRPRIDVRHRDDSNGVNLDSPLPLFVALLGSELFDTSDVDPRTLAFGPLAARHALPLCPGSREPCRLQLRDVVPPPTAGPASTS